MGSDVLDMFAKGGYDNLSLDELLKAMGLGDGAISDMTQDMNIFRSRALLQAMTQNFVQSIWNLPEGESWEYKPGHIMSVTDGDTFEVEVEGKVITIRLAGVDTAEVYKDPKTFEFVPNQGGIWARGEAAKIFVEHLLMPSGIGASVTVKLHPTQRLDKYGRTLAFITLPDGRDLSITLVKEGQGMIYGSEFR
jgi:endonuclease YncB( thermonuclease family)